MIKYLLYGRRIFWIKCCETCISYFYITWAYRNIIFMRISWLENCGCFDPVLMVITLHMNGHFLCYKRTCMGKDLKLLLFLVFFLKCNYLQKLNSVRYHVKSDIQVIRQKYEFPYVLRPGLNMNENINYKLMWDILDTAACPGYKTTCPYMYQGTPGSSVHSRFLNTLFGRQSTVCLLQSSYERKGLQKIPWLHHVHFKIHPYLTDAYIYATNASINVSRNLKHMLVVESLEGSQFLH